MTRLRIFLIVLAALGSALTVLAGVDPTNAQQGPAGAGSETAIALPDAIADRLVEAEFRATGSASGAAVLLRLRRLVAEELTISVPTGMLLLNEDQEEQDMAVRKLLSEAGEGRRYRPATLIELRNDDEHIYIVEAYCLEAQLDNPTEGNLLTFDGFVGADLTAVLEAVDRVRGADDNILAIQAAVWSITDDLSRAELDRIGYRLSNRDVDVARTLIEVAGLDPTRFRLFAS